MRIKNCLQNASIGFTLPRIWSWHFADNFDSLSKVKYRRGKAPSLCYFRPPLSTLWTFTLFRRLEAKYVAFSYDDWTMEVFKRGHAVDVGCYPNDVQLIRPYLGELRGILKFRPEFVNHARNKLKLVEERYWSNKRARQHKRSGSADLTYVGVHIRRKDYSNHLEVLYNRTFVSTKYFHKAMDFYRKQFKVSLFSPTFILSILQSWKFCSALAHLLQKSCSRPQDPFSSLALKEASG